MELLVYSALLAIIMTFAVIFVISITKETAKSSIKSDVFQNVASILREFEFEVHHASAIYIPSSDFVGNPGQLSVLSPRAAFGGEDSSYIDMYVSE